jgi:PAS domain S-box-containing protein
MDQKALRQTTEQRLQHSGSFKTITYLCLFGLAITVPLLLLLGALLLQSVSAERAQLQGQVSQAVDALVSDLDRDMDRDITILHTLATSQALARADWPTFYDQAKAGLQGRAYLVLVDSDGRQLVNTYVPYGQQPAITGDPETVRRIVQAKEPVVSNYFVSLVVKKPVFNVSIPILQSGRVRYVMSLGRLPDDLVGMLNSQKLGPQWVTLVWDAKGMILARSQDNARYIGRRLPKNMREHAQPAVVRMTSLDGTDVLHATARSSLSGWGVGVNVPYSLIAQPMRNSLLLWGVAAILAVTIALVLGLFFARPITTSLSAAGKAASAFGNGEAFALTGSRLKEADEFLITLRNAQRARQELTEELKRSRDWLHTTLTSIGDAVIATDAQGMVILMNSVAEELTGWELQEAEGKPLSDIFRIINEETRQAVENPVEKVRRLNSIVGLANHTVLISKNGEELAIDDSGAPIFGADGMLAGVVLVFRDVSEQRAHDAESQSKAAETTSQRERLAGIISSAMDAIITIDESQRIVVFNRAAEQIFDCCSSEAIGQPLHKFIPERFHHAHRQHIEGFAQTGVTNRSMSRPGNLWARRSGGQEFPIEATISQVQTAGGRLFTVVLRDVTEKKEAETKLAEQAGLLELTSDAIIVRDELGGIAYWNKGAETLYGFSQVEAVGKVTHNLLRTKFPQPLTEILDRLSKEKHWHGELVHTRKDGEPVIVLSRWEKFHSGQDSSDARTVLELNTDITRSRQLEAALQSNERLALAGRLSASIAHEINNPIDAVSNALYLINQRIGGQREVGELISLAQREALRVAEITRNMLSLHRESRAATTAKLSQLLEGVVALIEETISKGRRKIELVSGFEGKLEAFPSELRQVFTNVIKNAVEATADDGEIKIYSETAQISGRDGVLVSVIDNGVGIPEELKKKLFNPFVTTKEETGTGLGLWVSRSILEKSGGTIRIASNLGPGNRGTKVSIFLPLEVRTRKTAGDEPAERRKAAG